jgi:hypothetical protein
MNDQSFLSTADKTFTELDVVFSKLPDDLENSTTRTNMEMKNFLLRRGLTWSKEYDELMKRLSQSTGKKRAQDEAVAWSMRMSLKIIVNTYKASRTLHGVEVP